MACEFRKGLGQTYESAENLLSRRQFSQSHQGPSLQTDSNTDRSKTRSSNNLHTDLRTGCWKRSSNHCCAAHWHITTSTIKEALPKKQTLILNRPAVQSSNWQSIIFFFFLCLSNLRNTENPVWNCKQVQI